jgi:hypothetical protein
MESIDSGSKTLNEVRDDLANVLHDKYVKDKISK